MRLALGALALLSCAKPSSQAAPVESTIEFRGRAIDLGSHLTGTPYSRFVPDWDAGRVYFLLAGGGGTSLRFMPLGEVGADPAISLPLTSTDWSTRSMWGFRPHPSGDLFFLGDEANNERINLFRVSSVEGVVVPLTDEPYLYGASLSPDGRRWATVPRRGEGPFETCVQTMGLDGSDRRDVVCDTAAAPLSWSEPSWAPDGRGVLVNVNLGGRRDRSNLAWVPFAEPSLQIVTNPAGERTTAWALERWLDADRALVITTEAGAPTLSQINVRTGHRQAVTTFEHEVSDARLLDDGRLLVLLDDPLGDWLALVNPETGARVGPPMRLGGSASLAGKPHGSEALVEVTSSSSPRTIVKVNLGEAVSVTPWLAPSAELARRLVQCDVRRVRLPTHDVDPASGATRQLDALLYTPRDPIKPLTARILAFYGGMDRFDTETQVFCEAGIATLSPAVRGVPGHGEAFARLNDGDLGGDEIADLFSAAAYLEGEGYPRGRIGVYGRSHGGYATMRALTFPPGTNGHAEVYPFAFGISDAGFSDIVSFYETCNIPDWVILEAGDPVTEAARLHDRSPLAHVDRLAAPLLLVHGETDSRVPANESRQLAAACDALGKSCSYLEIPGQGHRVQGVANEVLVYKTKLDFLAAQLFD